MNYHIHNNEGESKRHSVAPGLFIDRFWPQDVADYAPVMSNSDPSHPAKGVQSQ